MKIRTTAHGIFEPLQRLNREIVYRTPAIRDYRGLEFTVLGNWEKVLWDSMYDQLLNINLNLMREGVLDEQPDFSMQK